MNFCRRVIFLLLVFVFMFPFIARADTYSYLAGSNITAGDAVVLSTTADTVETTATANVVDVVGIALETKSVGQRVRIIDMGGHVTCNITGAIAANDPLVTTTIVGALGVGVAGATGIVGYATSASGVPAAGQCYAKINVGWSDGLGASLGIAETISADWVNIANPWADNEVANAITVDDAGIAATIHRDNETKDGDLCSFDDADSNFTATDLDSAVSELDDTNGSGVNATDYKVNWTQLGAVPAGFADGVDADSGGTGDISDVFGCASGDCNSIAAADGDLLNFAAVNNSSGTEGLILPQGADVSAGIAEGQIGWDSDNDIPYIGTGAAVVALSKDGHTQAAATITDFDTEVGNHADVAANTSARHTQGADPGLDAGGANAVTAATIVSHNGNTSNPHGVTAAQAGAPTLASALQGDVAGEINAITGEASPASTDVLLLESANNSWAKRKVAVSALIGSTLHNAGMINDVYCLRDDWDLVDGYGITYSSALGGYILSELPGATGGEANTASNLGTGADAYKQKVVADLQFRTFESEDESLSIEEQTNELNLQIVNRAVGIYHLGDFAVIDIGTLNVKVLGGRFRNDNVPNDVAEESSLAMTDDATNYVEIDVSLAAIAVNQSGFTAGDIPLAVVVAASGDISSVTDKRTWLIATPDQCDTLTVSETDGTPDVADVTETKYPPNYVVDHGDNTVTINPFDISRRLWFYDDFLGDVLDDRWTSTATGTGASAALVNSVGGAYRLTSGTAVLAGAGLYQGTDSLEPYINTKKAIFETEITIAALPNNVQVIIGFIENPATASPGAGDSAYFYCRNSVNSGLWQTITYNDASAETQSWTISPVATATLRIELDTSEVRFYIDGTLLATHETQAPDEQMGLMFICQQVANPGTTATLDVDAVYVTQDR